ncbi:MAG: pilus assembly protein PilP [bacterium]
MMIQRITLLAGIVTLVTGCSSGSQHPDLDDFMEQARNAPAGEIEPLPTYAGYVKYNYSALALRSPFEAPSPVLDTDGSVAKESVKPDENRQKEFLESFNFSALDLVGFMSKDGRLWALINDGAGGIHRVTVGNYLGKNHGQIVALSSTAVEVVEIVPDGKGKWLERPRTLALNEQN